MDKILGREPNLHVTLATGLVEVVPGGSEICKLGDGTNFLGEIF